MPHSAKMINRAFLSATLMLLMTTHVSSDCCYPDDVGTCSGADQGTCTSRTSKKAGCSWKTGTSDCAPMPGCCRGTDSACSTTSEATCTKNARKKGCEWVMGTTDAPPDCSPPTSAPGCCAGGGVCEDADNDYCVNNRGAKKAGCAWISGEDAGCAPLPGCCYGTSSECWDATQSSCGSRNAKKAGCAWIEGTTDAPPDCTPPTPEPGCCAGEGVCENADNDYCVNNRMAKKANCEWISGKDANCEATTTTTTTSTPATICETGLLMTGWVDSGDVELVQLNDEYEFGAMGPSGYPWYEGSHNGYVMFVETEFMNVHISVSFKNDPIAWCSGTDIAACTVGQWFPAGADQSAEPNAGLEDCMPTTTEGTGAGCCACLDGCSSFESVVCSGGTTEKSCSARDTFCEWKAGVDPVEGQNYCEPTTCCFGLADKYCSGDDAATGSFFDAGGSYHIYCADCLKEQACLPSTTQWGGPVTTHGGPVTTHGDPTTSLGGPVTTHGDPTTSLGGPVTTHGDPTTSLGGPVTTHGDATTTTRAQPPVEDCPRFNFYDSLEMKGWVNTQDSRVQYDYTEMNTVFQFGGTGPTNNPYFRSVDDENLYLFIDSSTNNVHIEAYFVTLYAWCPGTSIAACAYGPWYPAEIRGVEQPNYSDVYLTNLDCMASTTPFPSESPIPPTPEPTNKPGTNWCNGDYDVDGCGISGADGVCGICDTLDGREMVSTTDRPDECSSDDSLLMTGWVDSGDVELAQLNDEYEYGAVGPSGYPWYVGAHNGLYMFVETDFMNVHISVSFKDDPLAWCSGTDIAACSVGQWFPAGADQSEEPDAGLVDCMPTTDRPDEYSCGVCDEFGCCLGDPHGSYWYRCDPRAGAMANPGWTVWSTVKENCESNAGYGCNYVEGATVDNGQCVTYEDQFDGCCVKGNPTNTNDWTDKSDCEKYGLNCEGGDDCAFVSEMWGKDVCLSWGVLQRGCEWRAGASGDECKANQLLSCNDQYDAHCINDGDGVSEY